MKYLFLVFALLPAYVFSQPFTFTEVVTVDSTSKDVLYERAKEWLSNNLTSSKDAIDYENKEEGKILARMFMVTPIGMWSDTGVEFNLAIYVKEGRYKYDLTNFNHVDLNSINYPGAGGSLENEKPACGGVDMTKSHWMKIKEQVKSKVTLLTDTLSTAMHKETESESETW